MGRLTGEQKHTPSYLKKKNTYSSSRPTTSPRTYGTGGRVLKQVSAGKVATTAPRVKEEGGIKEFVKNIPSVIVRGFTSPVEFMERTGGAIGGYLAKKIPLNIKPSKKAVETAQKFKRHLIEGETKLPGQSMPIITSTPYKTPKEFLGGALEAGIDIGLGITGATALSGAGEQLAKEGVKSVAKQAVKKTPKQIAKTIATDAAIGGGYGAASGLQKDEDLAGILKNIGAGAIVGAVAPPVLGRAAGATGRVLKFAGQQAGKGLEKTAARLEQYSTKGLLNKELEKLPVGKIVAQREGKQSISQEVAGKTAEGLRFLRQVPKKFSRSFLDPSYDLKESFKKAPGLDISDNEVKDIIRRYETVKPNAGRKASEKIQQYAEIRNKYADVSDEARVYARGLDMLDRINLGQKVEGDLTRQEVLDTLTTIRKKLPPEKFDRVLGFVKEHNQFWDNQLKELVGSRLSQEEYEYIRKAHPHYMPSRILDTVAEVAESPFAVGGRASSSIKKAKGSVKAREDVDVVAAENIFKDELFKEENAINRDIIEKFKDTGLIRPVILEENVRLRKSYYDTLKDLKTEIKQLLKDKRFFKRASREEQAKLKKLYDKLSKDEDNLFQEMAALKGDDGDAERLYEEMLRRKDIEEALSEISFGVPEVENAYQEFKKKLNRSPKLRDHVNHADQLKNLDAEVYKLVEASANLSKSDVSVDDMFRTFKERYLKERNSPTADRGFLRKYQSAERRVQKAQEKLLKTEDKIRAKARRDLFYKKRMEDIDNKIKEINSARRTILDDLSELRKIANQEVEEGFKAVKVFKNGVEEKYLVPEDLANAVAHLDFKRARWLSNLLASSAVGKVLTFPGRFTRAVATTLNPFFAFKNIARDFQTSQVTAGNTFKNAIKGLVVALAKNRSERARQIFKEVEENGAIFGNLYDEFKNPRDLIKTLIKDRDNVNTIFGKAMKFSRSAKKFLEEFGSRFEEATRVSVFLQARQAGFSAKEAGYIARNATIDFTKVAPVTRVLNQIIPFLNARIQGFRNTVGALKRDPEQFVRVAMMTSVYPAALLYAYNTKFPSYDLIPDYEKRLFWIIMVGESKGIDRKGNVVRIPHYIKIPKGESQVAISAMVDRIFDVERKENPEELKDFLSGLVNDISPVQLDVSAVGPIAMPFELASNKKFFTGASIEPEGQLFAKPIGFQKRENIPTQLRYKETTTEVAKELSKLLGGKFGLSPARIDYLISQGVLGDLLRVPQTLGFKAYPKEPSKRDVLEGFDKYAQMPGIRAFIGNRNYQKVLDDKEKEIQLLQEELEKEFKTYYQ